MPFDGLRVLSLESRRAEEMATLIRKQGGDAFVAPSMREVPLDRPEEAFSFAHGLLAGDFDCTILLTGVGTRLLWKTLLLRHSEEQIKNALRGITLVARGPKPSAALRDLGLVPNVLVPEPNTWREVLAAMDRRKENRLAIQEYGQPHPELIAGLEAQGRRVTAVRIYGWDLPEDTAPLREAAALLAARKVDAALFTTSQQAVNLFRIASEMGIAQQAQDGLNAAFVGSIGPTTTEMLESYGVRPDFEPSHPKMGLLVNEAAQQARAALARKR